VIGYLVQGGWIVHPTCTTFVVTVWSSDPSQLSVAAVLPTGITEERTYDGTVDAHSTAEAYPELFDEPDARCSMSFGRLALNPLAGAALALLGWLARRRQRR